MLERGGRGKPRSGSRPTSLVLRVGRLLGSSLSDVLHARHQAVRALVAEATAGLVASWLRLASDQGAPEDRAAIVRRLHPLRT